jgi:DNA-directed RNA polymerase specialized sigma24 family protein
MQVGRAAGPAKGKARADDFAGYLARNVTDAYRLATVALGDPVAAQGVVHDSALAAWQAGSDWSATDLDASFVRRFAADCVRALGRSQTATATVNDPLETALLGLAPRDRLELARALGPVGPARPGLAGRGSADKRLARILRSLQAGIDGPKPPGSAAGGSSPEEGLRALYAVRDPGDEIPLQLRLRIQRSLYEAETAAAEKDEMARANGWGFVFNLSLAVLVLALVVAAASVLDLRGSPVASADPIGDPSIPLTIEAVSVVEGGVDGPNVHVAAAQTSFVAAFEESAGWHVSPQQCLADVVGVLDPFGQAQWLGEKAGHVQAIVGDPSSAGIYATGPGPYCQLGRFSSVDGGLTWLSGSLPNGAAASPPWLAFDPARAGSLFAFDTGLLYASSNTGSTWTSRRSDVTPIGFDSTGRLVGWSPGNLFESLDESSTWRRIGPGPADRPDTGAATSNGVLLGSKAGLWWYPLSAAPSLIRSGSVYSMAALGDGAVVLGADAGGHPWLGTVSDTEPGMSLATLPPELASLVITGGQVAANDSGAAIALSGPSSAIAFATFAR